MRMTSAERVKAALAGNDFDVYPVICPDPIATADIVERAKAFFTSAYTNAAEMAALAAMAHDYYGFDSVNPYFSIYLETAALGARVDWKDEYQLPLVTKRPLKKLDDLEIPQPFLNKPEFQCLLGACEILHRKYAGEVPVIGKVIGPWTLLINLYGAENLILDTILEPEKIKGILNELSVIPLEFAKAQFDAGADMITWVDHATSDLVSAEMYREFLLPIHIKAAETLQNGGPLILHICGNVMDRLDSIARTGFKMFHMNSRNNIAAAVQQTGSTITITGCINNPVTLSHGSPAAVKEEVDANIKSGIRLIAPECSIPASVPAKNVKSLVESAHRRQPLHP